MTTLETRTYPQGCTSAFCGRTDCTGCPKLPQLEAFKAWRERTAAVQADHIWSPNVYRAACIEISNERLVALARDEVQKIMAGEAGDQDLIAACSDALAGDAESRVTVAQIIHSRQTAETP
jgi:hypothetical protein